MAESCVLDVADLPMVPTLTDTSINIGASHTPNFSNDLINAARLVIAEIAQDSVGLCDAQLFDAKQTLMTLLEDSFGLDFNADGYSTALNGVLPTTTFAPDSPLYVDIPADTSTNASATLDQTLTDVCNLLLRLGLLSASHGKRRHPNYRR